MRQERIRQYLQVYFITDDGPAVVPFIDQVRTAIRGGATIIQYRNKHFRLADLEEVRAICNLCRCNGVPFVVNDDVLLASAVRADGIHLGQHDEDSGQARRILGVDAIVGITVSNLTELAATDLSVCDYISSGPAFPMAANTKANSDNRPIGIQQMVNEAPVPVVASGGVTADNAKYCFQVGAAGVAVISYITRADNPLQSAQKLAKACRISPRQELASVWQEEFGLINRLLSRVAIFESSGNLQVMLPGDDACLLHDIQRPVISTDTLREDVHFQRQWLTPEELGQRAVAVTLSDLAASYARPVALFVNLGLPGDISEETTEAIYDGIGEALHCYGGRMGGGNLSRAKLLTLDLFAIGEGHAQIFPQRSEARPGDGLYATGPLGLARTGLRCLRSGDPVCRQLIGHWKNPKARFDAARVLADHGVQCVMDLSDGLSGDAGHIARASNVTIDIKLPIFNLNPDMLQYCRRYKLDPVAMACAGGEDYELLFACAPELFEKIQGHLPGALQVGRCLEPGGQLLTGLPKAVTSFHHGQRRKEVK